MWYILLSDSAAHSFFSETADGFLYFPVVLCPNPVSEDFVSVDGICPFCVHSSESYLSLSSFSFSHHWCLMSLMLIWWKYICCRIWYQILNLTPEFFTFHSWNLCFTFSRYRTLIFYTSAFSKSINLSVHLHSEKPVNFMHLYFSVFKFVI